ncbi:ATP-binding cassette sub- G member 1 [Asimina triloba]
MATNIDSSIARGWPFNGFMREKRRDDHRPPDDTNSQDDMADNCVDGCFHASAHEAAAVEVEMEMQDNARMVKRTQVGLREEEGGVFVTWEDLWVTAWNGKAGSKAILQGLTGYAQPGQVLAIMGPSGCGKSTLLDALAGRLGSKTRQSGEIVINGRKQALAYGTSAYVTQDDALMTTLTVREAVYYSAQLQLPNSMPKSEKKERAETTIREMGLQDAMDTRIGGWASKGLSGGEKRRVSICIDILTRPKLLFLDEPTSGLDSAASYHVMNRIVGLSKQGRRTIIASIHQPSGDVFDLFDTLGLLSSGRTVYFGPAASAIEDIEQGSRAKPTPEVIEVLVSSYHSSVTCQQVSMRIANICKMKLGELEKGSQSSFLTQSVVLTRRSFVNKNRDLGCYWLRLVIFIAVCLCIGNVYNNIGNSFRSIQTRGSMLVFVAAFLTSLTIGGFPSFVEEMKVFGQERLNGHYGAGAFVIGNTFSSIPYLVVVSVVPGSIAYFLVELQRGTTHFLYFSLVLFVCMMLVESLMMIVAGFIPDFLMGMMTGAGIQGLMILNGGFFRLPRDLPNPFWKYPMYYIAFHKYAIQGFYKNELMGLTFPNDQAGGPPTITGEQVLENMWQVEMGHSKWVDLGILIGMVLLYRLIFLGILKVIEKGKPMMRAIFAVSPKKAMQVMEHPSTPEH